VPTKLDQGRPTAYVQLSDNVFVLEAQSSITFLLRLALRTGLIYQYKQTWHHQGGFAGGPTSPEGLLFFTLAVNDSPSIPPRHAESHLDTYHTLYNWASK